MSIAASVAIRPSPCLRALRAGLLASVLAVGAWSGQPLLAAALLAGLRRDVNCSHLDISGVGEIRLTVYRKQCRACLLDGCTVWPGVLLLHMALDDGRRLWLVLLPDSIAGGEWRRLQAAIRAQLQKI
ncbi:protein YgfX [Pseudoduganella violaceinigra]|uniref:protein YgfX n=1 Tax=Pseudoduganella violaceinigra TaxID=246602 RepID=UPI0004228E61|nr:protein YgfX [Pseudoduganella violaceinigra]